MSFLGPSWFDALGATEASSEKHKVLSGPTTFLDIPFHFPVHCTRVIWTCRRIAWIGVFVKLQDSERHRTGDEA